MYQYFGKVITKPNQRPALIELLTKTAEGLKRQPKSILYALSIGAEPNVLYITKIWTSQEAHEAYLSLDESRAGLRKATLLIENIEEVHSLEVVYHQIG